MHVYPEMRCHLSPLSATFESLGTQKKFSLIKKLYKKNVTLPIKKFMYFPSTFFVINLMLFFGTTKIISNSNSASYSVPYTLQGIAYVDARI